MTINLSKDELSMNISRAGSAIYQGFIKPIIDGIMGFFSRFSVRKTKVRRQFVSQPGSLVQEKKISERTALPGPDQGALRMPPTLPSEDKLKELWKLNQLEGWSIQGKAFQSAIKKYDPNKGKPVPERPGQVYKKFEQEVDGYYRLYGQPLSNLELHTIFRECCAEKTSPQALAMTESTHKCQWQERDSNYITQSNWGTMKIESFDHTACKGRPRREEVCNKFRININALDMEKGWPIVAKIISRKSSPFPEWKVNIPNADEVGKEVSRLKFNGQFTLYSGSGERFQDERFNEANIVRCLIEIEKALLEAGIRPAPTQKSDVDIPGLAFSAYRYDLTKEGFYQHASSVTEGRKQEYRLEPRYKAVCELVRSQ